VVSLANVNRAPTSALVTRDAPKEPWRDAEWQKLWLALKARSWTSLAIVPGDVGGPPDLPLTVAVTLARIGIMHLGAQIHVADATRFSLVHLEQFTEEVRRMNQDGELVIIALPTIKENPIGVALARSASASVLCILLGEMSSAEAKRTVDQIGPSNFIGSIVLEAPPPPVAVKASR